LVLLILRVLLRSFVRGVAARHATCGGAEHCVVRGVTGDAPTTAPSTRDHSRFNCFSHE
jgi:hypothetical protein